MKGILGRSLSGVDIDQEREKWSFWSHANPATPVCFLCLLVQLSRPGAPEGVCTRGIGVEVVCVLVIFSHLTLYSSTDSGWTSGKGGGFAHLDLRLMDSRVETKGTQTGVTISFSVPSGMN